MRTNLRVAERAMGIASLSPFYIKNFLLRLLIWGVLVMIYSGDVH